MALSAFLPSIAPGERIRSQHAAAGLMCAGAAGIVAKTTGTAVFLDHFGADKLAYMYIGAALLVTAAFTVYRRLLGRWSERRLLIAMSAAVLVLCFGVRLGLTLPGGSFRAAAYLVGDLVAKVPLALFWGFAAMLFDPREGKRLFPALGVAGTLACVAAGFAVPPLADAVGTEDLILVSALLIAGFAVAVDGFYRRQPGAPGATSNLDQRRSGKAGTSRRTGLLSHDLVRGLGALVAIGMVAMIFTDFLFMSAAKARYSGDELAAFLGRFWAVASVLSVIVQVFAVRWILQRGGVLASLTMLPAGLMIAAGAVGATAAFAAVVVAKVVEPTLLYSVDNAGQQMLYQGLPKQTRSRTRAFVDGLAKPLAVVVAGGALIVLGPRLTEPILALAIAGLCATWLLAARWCSRAYVAGLVEQLDSRRLDLSDSIDGDDPQLEEELRRALRSASDEDLPYLIDLASPFAGSNWAPEYRTLLERSPPAAQVAALELLARHGEAADATAATLRIEHPDPTVRLAAVDAVASLGGAEAVTTVSRCLRDPEPAVRWTAAARLLEIGDLDAVTAGSEALLRALEEDDPRSRAAVATALAESRHPAVLGTIDVLLDDEDFDVRAAALKALASHRLSRASTARVAERLSEPRLAGTAADVLVSGGEEIVPILDATIRADAKGQISPRVPLVLARIGGAETVPVLLRLLDRPDPALHREAIEALGRVCAGLPDVRPFFDEIDTVTEREIESFARARDQMDALQPVAGSALLVQALDEASRRHLENSLTLLGIRHPGVDMRRISRGLTGDAGGQRAAAIEVLDNVPRKSPLLRRLLMLLEPAPAAERSVDMRSDERLAELLAPGTEPWTIAAALYAVAESRMQELGDRVLELCRHADACVRETASYTASRLAEEGGPSAS